MNTSHDKSKFQSILYYLFAGILATFFFIFLMTDVVSAFASGLYPLLRVLYKATLAPLLGPAAAQSGLLYFTFLIYWAAMLIPMLVIKPWRPYLKCLGTKPSGNRIGMLLAGLAVGFVMNGFCILAAILTGSIHGLTFVQFEPLKLLILLVLVFIQSSCEEMWNRCFVYQRLLRFCGLPVAIIGNAAYFTYMHRSNSGVSLLAFANIFAIGIFFSLVVYYCDSLWMTMAIHTAWNFTQNFLFGLPNSGEESLYCLFKPNGSCTSGIAYDAVFGVEGSWVCLFVVLAAIALVIFWGSRHPGTHFAPCESNPDAADQAAAA